MAMREACDKFARTRPVDEAIWDNFAKGLFYVQGEFGEPDGYDTAAQETRRSATRRAAPAGAASTTSPFRRNFFRLSPSSSAGRRWSPIRSTAARSRASSSRSRSATISQSAKELNRVAVTTFRERQVFRIDHYLGKETVQNLLVLRFANGIFEPFWNRQYIDHVQVTVAESIGVEKRGGYFETAGITRDIIQNHMLQLVSLMAMEPPVAFEADAVRDEKVKVLRALREFPTRARRGDVAVRGQYTDGSVLGEKAIAYRKEVNVDPNSNVDTFAAMKIFIDNWRWADVPFYIRAGKRLPKRVTDISIHFRPAPYPLFNKLTHVTMQPNVLAIRIQPDEGISLKFDSKVPGPTVRTAPVTMEFRYATSFGAEPPGSVRAAAARDDARRLDALRAPRRSGDRVGVARSAAQCWAADPKPPDFYPAGTWGPEAAEALIERDGRRWRRP